MAGATQTRERLPGQPRPRRLPPSSLAATGMYAVAVVALVGAGISRHGPRRLLGNVAAHLGWMSLGLWHPEWALASREELRVTMNAIALPANFRRTGQTADWSRWDERFTAYTRHWVAAGDAEQVQAQVREVLVANRFVLGAWGVDRIEPGTATAVGVRGKFSITLRVDATGAWEDGRRLDLEPGHVGVTATLQKQSR